MKVRHSLPFAMSRQKPMKQQGLLAQQWLKTLRLESLCQLDVLIFLHQHKSSLLGAEHIARLLGYETGKVVDALDGMCKLNVVRQSRPSNGARIYRFNSQDMSAPQHEAFDGIIAACGKRGFRGQLKTFLRDKGYSEKDSSRAPADTPEQ